MWWILRRARLTGASLFSNSSNNNNIANSKPETRPPRKNYNQLSSAERLDNRQPGTIVSEEALEPDASSAGVDGTGNNEVPVCARDRYNNNVKHRNPDFSDDSDDDGTDEALTCNVCDRSYPSRKMLADHQQKKRHFGCGACDSLFPSFMALEHHKEEFEHWSDSSYCSHSDSEADSDFDPHDRHRLL